MKRNEQDRSIESPIPQYLAPASSSPTQERATASPVPERFGQSSSSIQQRPGQSTTTSSRSATNSADLREAIRLRAYQIYEQRGMVGGSEIEDWLQAEAELLDTHGQRKAA
jgi:Protein of unknown function (DUF2934)